MLNQIRNGSHAKSIVSGIPRAIGQIQEIRVEAVELRAGVAIAGI